MNSFLRPVNVHTAARWMLSGFIAAFGAYAVIASALTYQSLPIKAIRDANIEPQ